MWFLDGLVTVGYIVGFVLLFELAKRKLPKRVSTYLALTCWTGLMLWLAYEGFQVAAWIQFGFLELMLCADIYFLIRKKRLKEKWERYDRQLTRDKAARARARWILGYKVTPKIRDTWNRQELKSYCCDCEHYCESRGTCGRCMPGSPMCKELRGEPAKKSNNGD